MRVKIVYLGLIRSKIGKREEEFELEDGSSLFDLLNNLIKTYSRSLNSIFYADEGNRLDPTFVVTVNGMLRDAAHVGEFTLHTGDTVALMNLISGG